MAVFYIKKGKNINLKGAAAKEVVALPFPQKVGIQPGDFRGLKASLAVKVDHHVKAGTPLLRDKIHPEIHIASPVSGKVVAVNRGDKRVLLSIVIETDPNQESEVFPSYSKEQIASLKREDVITQLQKGGLWPVIRQRPFSKIADPSVMPKSIFVHAMSTEPLALNVDVVLEKQENDFQVGLDVVRKLTNGKTHLCVSGQAKSKALTQAQNVEIHQFFGPHPAGNVSTHIHHVDPINKGEAVWYVDAQDVLRIAKLFQHGVHSAERVVALTGPVAQKKLYAKTVAGAPISFLMQGSNLDKVRCISGSILGGNNVGAQGFLGYYHSQVTLLPEGGRREFLGWLTPGFDKFSFSNTYMSSFNKDREVQLDTDKNGSDRAIVLNHVFDQYVPLDILTYFLIKAIMVGDIDECEKLGILECDEEDFALASFACPSKTDVGGIIRKGLETIEKEG